MGITDLNTEEDICKLRYSHATMILKITALKETTGLTDLPSLMADRHYSLFGHIRRLSRDTRMFRKHYIYPLMPSPAHLLPLTGSALRAVHGELGFNRWKKIWVYPIGACQFATLEWTARCGDRYDPQPVNAAEQLGKQGLSIDGM